MTTKELLIIGRKKIRQYMFILISFTVSCKAQEYSVEKVMGLEPTHKIAKDDFILVFDYINKNSELYNEDDDTYVFLFETTDSYDVKVTKTKFNLFRDFKSKHFKNLKGYLKYKEMLVLLYGDVSESYLSRTDATFIDVAKSTFTASSKKPPIIYEPNFLRYKLE